MEFTSDHLNHPFILLINNAEHNVLEKTDENNSLVSKNKIEFNGFLNIDDFKKELNSRLESYLESVEKEINSIQFKADRVKFLNKILKDLDSFKGQVFKLKGDKIIQHLKYKLNNDLKDNFYSENGLSIAKLFFETQLELLIKSIEKLEEEKKDLKSLSQEDINRTFESSSNDVTKCLDIKKIKTSLTVQELAFFFKILKDANIFEPNNTTDFGKVVSEIFSSKKKNSFSQATFMKEYYKSTDDLHDVAVKFSNVLLPELKRISESYKNLKK